MASGEFVGAIAISEPGAGSDLQGVRTTARRDANHYVISGQKTFISNGQLADVVIVVAKTNPSLGAKGISLIVVETNEAEGFQRGRNLDKLGLEAQDTSELFFTDVHVPTSNLLGAEEGAGLAQLMQQLPQERLTIAVGGVATIKLDNGALQSHSPRKNFFLGVNYPNRFPERRCLRVGGSGAHLANAGSKRQSRQGEATPMEG
jgi:acyl-CoA dehydrogenase